jgi:DNA-binding response OmpR family regulator
VEGKPRILVVEEEEAVLRGLKQGLEQKGFEVLVARSGPEGIEAASRNAPDLVVLDAMLSGLDGYEVCRALRRRHGGLPIVMLTAKTDTFDRVLPLELGADDCVSKPFSFRELLVRIRVRLRRGQAGSPGEAGRFRFADVEIDFDRYAATRGGEPLELTPKEFDILRLLVRCRGEVVTRERLLDEVWGYDAFPSTRTVDAHMVKLRKKIEPDPSNPKHILSVYGLGYKLVG